MKYAINPAGIQYRETFKGVAYRATLLQDGVAVACIQNDGDGGATYITNIEPEFDRTAYRAEVKAADTVSEFYLERLMDAAEGVANHG